MVGVVLIIIGIVCLIVSRLILVRAAFEVSVWWGLIVFLPFGPWLFLSCYPDLDDRYGRLRIAAFVCVVLGLSLTGVLPLPHRMTQVLVTRAVDWFCDASKAMSAKGNDNSSRPLATVAPDLQTRSSVNVREFQRLRACGEALRLRKRDLLNSDTEHNQAYTADLALYNDALAKATAERDALAAAGK